MKGYLLQAVIFVLGALILDAEAFAPSVFRWNSCESVKAMHPSENRHSHLPFSICQQGGGSNVKCRYCSKTYDRKMGYVVALQTSCADKYATLVGNIALAQKLGYPEENLKLLAQAIYYGDYYCSRRCVDMSGVDFCPE